MMRRLRRRPTEHDWHADLAEHSSELHLPVQLDEPVVALRGWLPPRLGRRIVALGVAGVYVLLVFNPAQSYLVQAGLFVAPIVVSGLIRSGLRRGVPPGEQLVKEDKPLTVEDRVEFKLSFISRDLQWFLARPTERATYERWLKNATNALAQLSPEVANRWAKPDLGRTTTGEMVSVAELNARRDRLLELYAEVASPKELARLRAALSHAPSARAITSS